jgi:hypothetical protein
MLHKRTSSAAENTTAPSAAKRVDVDSSPQHVYVVITGSAPPSLDNTSDIDGIYATISDANNAVQQSVNEYGGSGGATHRVEDDARVYWSSDDAVEGESVEISAGIFEVKPAGAELVCELLRL